MCVSNDPFQKQLASRDRLESAGATMEALGLSRDEPRVRRCVYKTRFTHIAYAFALSPRYRVFGNPLSNFTISNSLFLELQAKVRAKTKLSSREREREREREAALFAGRSLKCSTYKETHLGPLLNLGHFCHVTIERKRTHL